MRPIDVARQLHIGDSTVRAWSNEFRKFLSISAAGGDGRRRDFTLQDAQILGLIKQRLDHSTPRDEIIIELTRLQAGDWRELPPLPNPLDEENPSAMIPMATAQTAITVERQAMLREINTLRETVNELKEELSQERGDKERLLREVGKLEGQVEMLREMLAKKDSTSAG